MGEFVGISAAISKEQKKFQCIVLFKSLKSFIQNAIKNTLTMMIVLTHKISLSILLLKVVKVKMKFIKKVVGIQLTEYLYNFIIIIQEKDAF